MKVPMTEGLVAQIICSTSLVLYGEISNCNLGPSSDSMGSSIAV